MTQEEPESEEIKRALVRRAAAEQREQREILLAFNTAMLAFRTQNRAKERFVHNGFLVTMERL